MLDLSKLTEEDIGRWVRYSVLDYKGNLLYESFGRIKTWNERYVFVVYERPGRDMNRFMQYAPQATCPDDLEFVEGYKEHIKGGQDV